MLLANGADIVLMDVQMPVMSGLDATRIIRRDIGASLPVIALTANAIKGENHKCLAVGMDDFLSKPFEENDLVNMISKWLGKSNPVPVPEAKADAVKQEQKLYDLSRLEKLGRNDPSVEQKMVRLFLEKIPSAVQEIKAAWNSKQFDIVSSTAHRIKPVLHHMGIDSLKNEIKEIEQLAAENKCSERLQELIVKMDKTLEAVVADIKVQKNM
jgi:DNA-binding response OmpR family regulator